ncbi:hypothetical protein [Mucilaginibacter arboris]|uniref:Uncharacterized protein n=1 Tax=Mucilaginibacter arboris TaxID=2682090 RepID=A0A7K1SX93_9SPHI|nr:hypothetical protein [Mucilaginibacter arboris]MVN21951.1 hypothetical protein [Mucilaginibacter arboris]
MVAIAGTYQDGYVKLDREFSSTEPVKVIVTFLEDIEISSDKRLTLSDFSFAKSQKILEEYKGSLSDEVIEERRSEV